MTYNKEVRDFLMGCDPEFLMLWGNKSVAATGFTIWNSDEETCGSDGGGVAFEARPEPSRNPLELVTSIRQIFIHKLMRFPMTQKFEWRAGTYFNDHCLGGHIHFAIRSPGPTECVPVLSEYLGACSMLIEDKAEGKRRREMHDDYGGYISWRKQSYGFEYRTCGSWLTSPYIAAAHLCLGKVVMHQMLNQVGFKNPNRFDEEVFASSDLSFVAARFPELWAEVTEMQLYPLYKEYLDIIPFLVKKRLSWFPSCSMKDAWGISHITPSVPEPIQMQDIWRDYRREPTV